MSSQELNHKIYVYTNLKTGKPCYVGQTNSSMEKRAGKDGKGYIGCDVFWRAIQKNGWSNFKGEIVEDGLSLEEANEREQYWISELHTLVQEGGYNLRAGGNNAEFNDLTIQKMKELASKSSVRQYSMDGQFIAEYSSMKEASLKTGIRQGSISNCCKGRCFTAGGSFWSLSDQSFDLQKKLQEIEDKKEETRKKRSLASKGRKMSDEAKKNMSEAQKGHPVSDETRIKSRESHLGKKDSEETKERKRIAQLKRYEEHPFSEESKRKVSEHSINNPKKGCMPVCQYTKDGQFVAEYPSIMEAHRQTGIDHGSISACCKGLPRYKSAGGYLWCFKGQSDLIKNYVEPNNLPKAVCQYSLDGTFIKQYSTASEAGRETGISSVAIGQCCRGRIKTSGKYRWKFAEAA